MRKRCDDVFHYTVSKVLLLRRAAQVGERKHGDRRPVGKRQLSLRVGLLDRRGGLQTDKSITAAGYCDHVGLPALTFFQRLSKRRDMDVDIAFLDDQPGPDLRHQFVLGDDLALRRDQYAQDVERPVGEAYRGLVA